MESKNLEKLIFTAGLKSLGGRIKIIQSLLDYESFLEHCVQGSPSNSSLDERGLSWRKIKTNLVVEQKNTFIFIVALDEPDSSGNDWWGDWKILECILVVNGENHPRIFTRSIGRLEH